MVSEESARQKQEREERERKEREERERHIRNWRRWWTVIWCSLPVCMVIGSVWMGYGYELMSNYVKGFFLVGPMLWLFVWLAVLLVWMIVHFNDSEGDNHYTGGSSSGVEWGRVGMWFMRSQVRKQMRKLSR